MAAGVHRAVHAGGVVNAGVLLHGETIHVGAQEDHGLLSRSVGRTSPQYCGDRRRFLPQGDLVRKSVQRLEHFLLRAGELQSDLRFAVEVVAEADDVPLQFFGVGGECHEVS